VSNAILSADIRVNDVFSQAMRQFEQMLRASIQSQQQAIQVARQLSQQTGQMDDSFQQLGQSLQETSSAQRETTQSIQDLARAQASAASTANAFGQAELQTGRSAQMSSQAQRQAAESAIALAAAYARIAAGAGGAGGAYAQAAALFNTTVQQQERVSRAAEQSARAQQQVEQAMRNVARAQAQHIQATQVLAEVQGRAGHTAAELAAAQARVTQAAQANAQAQSAAAQSVHNLAQSQANAFRHITPSVEGLRNAQRQVSEASSQVSQALARMNSGQAMTAAQTQRFQQALSTLAGAERNVQVQTGLLAQSLANMGVTGQAAQRIIQQVTSGMRGAGSAGASGARGIGEMAAQMLGAVGAAYLLRQALRSVISEGREFELTIRQAQAVTDNFTSTLRDLAMASKGDKMDIHGPLELAKAYRELGQAGANTQEIIKATPEILEFSTAAMLDMEQAAYGVVATAKSFGIALTDTRQITDAFTQAMNQGALTGKDFQWIMSSAGAVAKMAGQDFREILSVGSAMRDAGVQAQDAGTSIKSALMALINPTGEASDTMKALGIDIYDASGKMKQWSEITADFEKALTPFNDKGRQLALTTIFGSDGIRAMSTSINKGSGYLKEFTEGLKNADGATHKMASAMADTFDGAIRRTNASLERAKVLLFEDFAKGAVGLLGVINNLISGFNSLDEGSRRAVETIVGGAGLVIALTILANVAKTAGLALRAMWASAGPVGWAIIGVSALVSGIMGYSQSQQQAAEAQQKANEKLAEFNRLAREGIPKERLEATKQEVKAIQDLVSEYDQLQKKIEDINKNDKQSGINYDEVKARESQKAITEELKNYGLTLDTARGKVEQLNQRIAEAIALDYGSVVAQANKATTLKQTTNATVGLIQEYLKLTETVKSENDVVNLSAAQKSRLSVVVGELAKKYPSLVTALDEHGKAMLLDKQGMGEQMTVMKALALIETQEARARIEAERAKTVAVIAQTRERLKAIIAEQKALRDANASLKAEFEMPAIKKVVSENPALAMVSKPIQFSDAELTEEMKQRQATREQAEKALKVYDDALKNLNSGTILDLSTGIGAAGTQSFGVPGKEGKGKAEAAAADATKVYTEAITEALYPYKEATEAAAAAVALLGAKEQHLSQVMQSGQGTAYQAIELNKVRAEQLGKLSEQQEALSKQADAQRLAMAELQVKYESATDPDAAKELRQEIENLTSSTNQLSQSWWQAEQQKLSLLEHVKQEEQKRYDDAYQQAMDLMRHQVTMAQMSTEQQIEYLQKLRDAYQWSSQQMASIDEDLYRLRKQQLSDYLGRLEDEYKSKLDVIEAKTKKVTDAIQAQIDAMEGEGKASSREEAARKHNEKLADLQSQRQYHELRTGQEHAKAIVDIDKQIADEQREYQIQQEEWARDDKKEALQKQLDDARKAGDEERKQLEDHYRRARKIAEGGIMDVIASLAATSPKWLQTGKDLIDQLIAGLESGDFSSVQKQVDQIRSQAPSATTTPESLMPEKHSQFWPWKSPINEIVWLKGEWKKASETGDQAGMDSAAGQAKKYYAQLPGWIADMLHGMSYDQAYPWYKSQVYHEGGMVTKYGPRKLAPDEVPIIAQVGEYYLPPASMADAIRGATVPMPGAWGGGKDDASAIERAADRIIAAIESKMGVNIQSLLRIDRFENNDETDIDILTRDLRRAVTALGG